MRDLDTILSDLKPGIAFSNSTQFEIWSPQWCDRCVHDDDPSEKFCPILTALLLNEGMPTEITRDDSGQGIVCSDFCEGE